jgi:hypothetical protein
MKSNRKKVAEAKLLTIIELYASMSVTNRWVAEDDFSFDEVRAMQFAERGMENSIIDEEAEAEYISELDRIGEDVFRSLFQREFIPCPALPPMPEYIKAIRQ